MDGELASSSVKEAAKPLDAFERIEHWAYGAVGLLLCVAAALALAGTVWALVLDLQDWSGSELIAGLIERLLFVLMLIEILHTVRASMRSGGLRAEPFLIVGIIASIRRVLVSTLESSEAGKSGGAVPLSGPAFRDSMLELAVLGFLIIVMVVAIYLLRRGETVTTED
jgi:uncharacterized membrane protein (DUF373 family)